MEQGFDLFGLIVAGGITTWPLLVGSVLALAVVIDRVLALRGTERAAERAGARLAEALARGGGGRALEDAAAGVPVATTVLLPVARAVARGSAAEDVARLLDARIFEALETLRQRLWLLATIGSIAPFVGLFGTVIGIMKSFHFIGETGTGGFAVVASGISEALVATALGLGVAVVAVAFYNYFEARLERIEATLRIQANHLTEAGDAALAA
ncbi:MAG TPA: MotA/TolQ/ExbB proton channel family protein [Candidatus Binatia bacterium]